MAENKQKPIDKTTKDASGPKNKFALRHLKPASRGSWLIIIGALVLLIGVGAYGVARIVDDTNTANTFNNEPDNPRFPKQEVRMEQLSFDALQTQVGKLELSNQYTDAKKLVKYQKYYGKNKQAQLLYASLCANQGSQKEALQTMLGIEKEFGESGTLAGSIAQQAVAAKDKKTAKEYYEKAIDLTESDKSNPVRKADANLYKEELKKLEGN